jgi:hypothetical protein
MLRSSRCRVLASVLGNRGELNGRRQVEVLEVGVGEEPRVEFVGVE